MLCVYSPGVVSQFHVSEARIAFDRGSMQDAAEMYAEFAVGCAPSCSRCPSVRSRYRHALDLDPTDIRSRVDLATIYLNSRQFDDAQIELERILIAEPSNVSALYRLMVVHNQRKETRSVCERAAAVVRHATEQHTESCVSKQCTSQQAQLKAHRTDAQHLLNSMCSEEG